MSDELGADVETITDTPESALPEVAEDSSNRGLWALDVVAELPEVPETMTLFTVVQEEPPITIADMQARFSLRGTATYEDALGGVQHVVDGDKHAYVFDDGAAAFHDIEHLGSEVRIVPLEKSDVWEIADTLLDALDLTQTGSVSLVHAKIGEMRVGLNDDDGPVGETWVTQQIAIYDQLINGWPTFGTPQVDITIGDRGDIIGFSHSIHTLEGTEEVQLLDPRVAIAQFGARAAETGRYNLHRAYIYEVDSVAIEDVRLGYYVPDSSDGPTVIEPVYELTGTVNGRDVNGQTTQIDLRWLEPAAEARGIDALNITAH